MSIEEKITQGEKLKEEGNQLFKQGQIKEALSKYHRALLYLHGHTTQKNIATSLRATPELSVEIQQKINTLLVTVYSNMSACQVSLQNWDKVIQYSSKALSLDADHFKARLRRVNAYLSTGALDPAERDLAVLIKQQSDHADVLRQQQRHRQLTKAAEEKQKRELAGMFDRGKK